MIYGSVCSGIEAASVAWHPLGWKAAWYSEIETFPSAVLKHRYPKTPNLGDMTKIHKSEVFNGSAIDVLVGGTPCQSFSIAGLRKGMDDPRGNLALVFLALLNRKRPRWVVWENVPGVLSSWSDEAGSFTDKKDGTERGWQSNDFDTFTSGLEQLGYGLAWRVLDAQYFGVPQRRQRVFVVGHLGDWRPAAAVLFESHGLSGHPAPRREARPGPAPDVSNCVTARGGSGRCDPTAEVLLPVTHTLRGEGFDASEDGTGRGTPLVPHPHVEVMPTLRAGASNGGAGHGARSGDSKDEYIVPMVTDMRGNGDGENVPTLTGHHAGAISDFSPMVFTQGNLARNEGPRPSADLVPTLQAKAGDQHPCIKTGMAVRRLTPRECERLQGFPDDYTLIPYRGGVSADGPRYKACGNSMAVPVMRWIGERIANVDGILRRNNRRE